MQNAVSILRELWRRPRFEIAAFALIALVIGGSVAFRPSLPPKSRQYAVGTASVRILVDTTDSRVVAIAPPDQPAAAENLGGHASLLAQLLSQGDAEAAVAKRAGISADKLVMIAPTEPGQKAEAPARHSRTADVLAIHTLNDDSGEPLPIIGVDAEAANGARAAKLAGAAVTGLQDYLKSKYASSGVPPDRQLLVRALNAPQGRDVTRGPSMVIGIGVSILVFCLLCSMLLVVLAIARQWRASWAAEQRHAHQLLSSRDAGDAAESWSEPDIAVEPEARRSRKRATADVGAAPSPSEPVPESESHPERELAPQAASPRSNRVRQRNKRPA